MNTQHTLLQKALDFALGSPHSDFYRRKFGPSYKEYFDKPIQEIPFLVRTEIDAVPVFERTFVPRDMVRFIRSTSGSTGKSVIGFPMLEEGLYQNFLGLIGYQKESGQLSRYFEPYFSQMNIRSMLLFSAGSFVHEVRVREMEGRQCIAGEFAQPKLTAELAKEANIEAIVGNPSGLVDFAPHLKAIEGADTVRLIISVGERPTSLQFAALQTIFPNAKIALQYGLTESQGYVGYTCPEKLSIDPKALHVADGTLFIELIDPDTEVVLPLLPGTEGELVVTTHEPQGFPLIRYRTGDFVRIRGESCACEGSPLLFECMGRLTLDRLRVPHGMLTIAAIEQAVSSLPGVQEFEAKWNAEGPLPRLEISLYMDSVKNGEGISIDELASRIRIAPKASYQTIVEEGRVLPLEVVTKPLEQWVGWKKKKRLH